MALLFCDGFENQSDPGLKWDNVTYNGNYRASGPTPRTGAKCMYFNALHKYVAASGSTAFIGCAFWFSGSNDCQLQVLNGGASWPNLQAFVKVNSSGAIEAWRGNGSVPLGTTAAGVFRYNQWNYIEAKIVLSQTVGSFTVKLNGETVLTVTGVDNCYLSNELWDSFAVTCNNNACMDDVYCCDASGAQNNDFLGEIRVVSILPVTDAVDAGANADFTCSTGTDHGALVDEAAPDGDTTYVYSSTVGHVDTWNFEALGYTGTIKGVQLNLLAKKTEASARAIVAVTRPTGTNRVDTTDRYLGMTNYISYHKMWELNPDDSAAWEVADVDGAEFGVKVTV